MLCQNCNKNEANVKYTQIINGEKKEMMLCEECSHKLGIDNMKFNLPISFSNFFSDFLDDYDTGFMPLLTTPKETKCDKCGMTYNDFIELGKFGCDNCYDVFSDRIDPILKRLQGNNRYYGKKAELNEANNKQDNKAKKEDSKQNKIEDLKNELKELVKQEKYEEAAKVRDEIKKLEVQE